MGVTLQWRDEPLDRDNRSYARTIEFGNRRDAGTGYMCHSDRVGPGVVIVPDRPGNDEPVRGFARWLNSAGFTVLVVDLDATAPAAVSSLQGATAFLADNWHPRVGVIGFGPGAAAAAGLSALGRVDATVLYYGGYGTSPQGPVLGHFLAEQAPEAEAALVPVAERGNEIDVFTYPVTHGDLSSTFIDLRDDDHGQSAHERTLDFLLYHLS